MDEYFKLKPYAHQERVWNETRDLEGYALFWEMGVGKSCATIGTASWLYRKGEIDALVIVAPNGVHRNWTRDEIPMHMPNDIQDETVSMTWYSLKAKQKKTKTEFSKLASHKGLAVFVISYDAVMTTEGSKALKALLTNRECLYVLDESGRIKTPGAKRTKRIMASASYAKYRRILTGTPVDGSPFDVFTQTKFVRPDSWVDMGCRNFASFKTRYGIFERRTLSTGRQFDNLLRYKNLGELKEIVDQIGSRLLKDDVLDLPPKLYQKRYFKLDPKQKKAYQELDKQFVAWLGENGTATAELVLTRMLRMQQLCSGFITNDDEEVLPIGSNVRLKCLKDTLEDVEGSAIIWCRWSWEFDQVRAMLGEKDAVYYDGRTSSDDREDAILRFQKEKTARFFVAKASAAGEGLTLHTAKTVIYMSNTYSLRERLQSEDRAHRAGMDDKPVIYVDLIAEDTYDDKLLESLRGKKATANIITGDKVTPWA